MRQSCYSNYTDKELRLKKDLYHDCIVGWQQNQEFEGFWIQFCQGILASMLCSLFLPCSIQFYPEWKRFCCKSLFSFLCVSAQPRLLGTLLQCIPSHHYLFPGAQQQPSDCMLFPLITSRDLLEVKFGSCHPSA